MKMTTNLRATLISVDSNASSDGRNTYYKVAIAQGVEVATLSCSKEVYDAKAEPYKNYDFDLLISEYEGKPTMRITRISEIQVNHCVKPDSAAKQ